MLLLWGMVIAIYIFCSILYIHRGFQRKLSDERMMLFALGLFSLTAAITRMIIVMAQFQVDGMFYDNAFFIEIEEALNKNSIYSFYGKLASITNSIGVLFIFIIYETILKRTKYILSTLMSILLVIYIKTNQQSWHILDWELTASGLR